MHLYYEQARCLFHKELILLWVGLLARPQAMIEFLFFHLPSCIFLLSSPIPPSVTSVTESVAELPSSSITNGYD
ncbi:hypothetical protein [Microcoleus sp. T2B6]|uniref:hypothetical protein n=1 Tax=Microcoleus sp. T2B6 TaxID=3055424 RepID=UPI002FCE75AE